MTAGLVVQPNLWLTTVLRESQPYCWSDLVYPTIFSVLQKEVTCINAGAKVVNISSKSASPSTQTKQTPQSLPLSSSDCVDKCKNPHVRAYDMAKGRVRCEGAGWPH